MGLFKINIWRHAITHSLELLIVLSCLACCLPGFLYSDPFGHNTFIVFLGCCFVVLSFHILFAIEKNRWDYPIRLMIHEDTLEIECKFLFFLPRSYHWKKENVRIVYYPEVIKLSSIVIYNEKIKVGILFESIAVKRERLNTILNDLRMSGYEIQNKTGK